MPGAVSRQGRARRATRRQGDLSHVLAMVAHELRAPLASLVASAEALAQDFDSLARPEAQLLAVSLHRRSLRMKGLVENLLCIATIDSDRLELQREWIELDDFLVEVVDLVEPLLVQRGQHCVIACADLLPMLHADRNRLTQVLVNLLSNAGKYGPRDSAILLEASINQTTHTVRINVSDAGSGIGEGVAAHLFEPYSRDRQAGVPHVDGVGLGLAIVKAIIDKHGGQVGAENRPEGGACFWLELPLWRPACTAD